MLELQRYTEKQLLHHLNTCTDPVIQNLYYRALEKYEPILAEDKNRFVLFPIVYQSVYDYYVKAIGSFWTAKEVSLSDDKLQWKQNGLINDDTKHFIKHILAFFAGADGIVNENLASRFYNEVQSAECRLFYGFQIAIENVHSEVYSLLIDTYIEQDSEKKYLFNAMETIPCVKKLANWSLKWMSSDKPFSQRVIAFACVEGIMFSGPFCAIYWLKTNNILPGLCFANELISRDESLHMEFACHIHSLLKFKTPERLILEIVTEVVDLEIEFINESIPCRLIGMNADSMATYVKFIADRLLLMLECQPYYNVKNPFDWMDLISMDNKTNIFEKRVSEYSRAGFNQDNKTGSSKIMILDDF